MEGYIQPITVAAAGTDAADPSSTANIADASDTPTPAVDAAATTDTPISTETTAAATTPNPAVDAAAPLYPPWVLLEREVHYYDCENATTAEAVTFNNDIVKVTFFPADPPAVSYFCVNGPKLEHTNFLVVPRVVFSVKDLVLLRFVFTLPSGSTVSNPNPAQYLVYKAGHGKPLLTPIPTSHRPNNKPSYPSILPFEDEDGSFLVADLAMTSLGHYDLHIFSSKTNKWTTRPLQFQASPATTEELPNEPHKAIALGVGTIGWIDLWRGIVVCNVVDPDPVLRFIPLPKPEFNMQLKGDPQQIRDVTCCNGFIKFVEMEHSARPAIAYTNNKRNCKTTKDLDSAVVLYDSELFFNGCVDLMENRRSPLVTWKIRTCYRHTSWNFWCKGHTVHVDDILVNEPSYYMMLPELWDYSAAKLTLRNLAAVCPALSILGGDVVYLVSKLGIYDEKAWVVGVDLRKKTMEVLEPYCAMRYSLHQTPFLACTFSGYLNTTPRSCAPEDGCGQNYPLNGYLRPGNIIENNLIVGGYSRSSIEHGKDVQPVNSFQFQPQLVVPPQSFPQTLQQSFTPSGSGYCCPVSTQSTYPVVKTDAHAQLCLLTPMDNRLQPQMPWEPASLAVPFNTLMRRMLMDDRSLPQMPPMAAYPVAPFDRWMGVRMQAPTSVPFNEPELVPPPATAANTLVDSN